MKSLVHIHTIESYDGSITGEDIKKYVEKNNIEAIFITDHNTIEGSRNIKKLLGKDILCILGAEYSTDEGHVLALFLKTGLENIIDKNKSGLYSFKEVVEHIKIQGGISYLAHPKNPSKEVIELIDGIEIYNSRVFSIKRNKDNYNIGKNKRKLIVAGNDAHVKNELGNCIIDIDAKENTEESLKKALMLNHIVNINFKTSNYFNTSISQLNKRKIKKIRSIKFLIKQIIKIIINPLFEIFKLLRYSDYYKTIKEDVLCGLYVSEKN